MVDKRRFAIGLAIAMALAGAQFAQQQELPDAWAAAVSALASIVAIVGAHFAPSSKRVQAPAPPPAEPVPLQLRPRRQRRKAAPSTDDLA
jgi:NO-binding membrane sensor protein with MHYT domain